MKPSDLLAAARTSVSPGPSPPGEAEYRRAVSTAYYGLFHSLASDCADLLIGRTKSDPGLDAWRLVYRALDHGPARERCQDERRIAGFPPAIRRFAVTFAQLQDERHKADYDPFSRPSAAGAHTSVNAAADAIGSLLSAPEPDRRARRQP